MSALFDLSGRLALVTGSSRGLGFALADGLMGAGAAVVLHGRNRDRLADAQDRLTEKHGVAPKTLSFDVANPEDAATQLGAAMDKYGVPDVLINNAGVQNRTHFNDLAPEDWQRVVATNLNSIFFVSQPITRRMVERKSGKVINIGSLMSQLGRETISAYTAAKGGVAQATKAMAADLTRFNIQVNTISPGYFQTEMTTELVADATFNEWIQGRTPAGRWGRPDELVGCAIFLASQASSFVSGQNIFVDGGLSAVV